jgi:hypothetical protein
MPSSEYQIGSGLSDSQLNAASLWVKHRLALRRLGYGSLVAFSILCWGYTLWSYLDAFVISWPRESRITKLIAQQAVPPDALRRIAPEPLQPGEAQAFETTDGRLDLLASLTNPNELWSARIKYRFMLDGQGTASQEVVVLPHSTRPLVELGWRGDGSPQLDVQSIQWQRIPLNFVKGSYDTYAAERQDFIISEEPSYLSLGEGLGKTDFTLTNHTGYGYWNVQVFVTLLRQGIPLAVNKIDVRELKPNEVRPISLQWFENVSGVDQVEVTPYVDILNPASYLPSDRI